MNKEILDLIKNGLVDETTSDNVLYIFDDIQELLKYEKQCLEKHYCMLDKIFATTEAILHGGLIGCKYKRYVFIKGDRNVKN